MSGYDDIRKLLKLASRAEVGVRMVAISGGSTGELAAFKAPEACVVKAVGIIPDAAITGANGDYMTLQFVNKGSDGTGTDVIGSHAYTLGEDVAQYDDDEFSPLANDHLAKGDTVTFEKAETGAGMAMPALLAYLVYETL